MRRLYGAGPLHLVIHVLLFLLVAYAATQIFAIDDTAWILVWLAAAVLLHDAVLWPLYASAATRISSYVRVPLGLSLILALVFVGTVTGKGESTYTHASGRGWDGNLMRWLIVSAVLCAGSAAVFLVRRRR